MAETDRPNLEVVTNDSEPSLGKQPSKEKPQTKSSGPKMPKWEQNARNRVKAAIKRFSKPLAEMVERDANEGDTRLLITDFLHEGLGYDKFSDLTTEYEIKGQFADYGIRIDKDLRAFVEVKRATAKLSAKHLRQVELYALNEGVSWVILTNGAQWRVYRITAGVPVQVELALEVDLLGEGTLAQKADQLFYLTHPSLKRNQIEELWKQKKATSPQAIAEILLSDTVAAAVRKEIRSKTGHRVEKEEVISLLKETVIKPECFEEK